MHTLRIVPVALTMAAAAAAQIPTIPIQPLPTRGMMVSFPAGVIMLPGDEIQKKAAGLVDTMGPFNTPDPVADYSVEVIRDWINTNRAPVSQLAIDAVSSGNDTLPLIYDDAHNEFRIAPANAQGWAVLYLGVEGDPVVGDAVVGYYFDNPVFPQQLQNGIYYELLSGDFSAGAIPSSMDIAMGLLEDNHGRLATSPSAVFDRVYFSLTPGSAQMLYNELYAASELLAHVSVANYLPPGGRYTGATIFEAQFDTTGQCVAVLVREDYVSLGFGVETGLTKDIDALGVADPQATSLPAGFLSLEAGGNLQFVFSLDGSNLDEQLLVVASVRNGLSVTREKGILLASNGDRLIGGTTGSLQSPVSIICGEDPEVGGVGGHATGHPDGPGTPGAGPYLSLSLAVRTTTPHPWPNDTLALTGVVSGWAGQPAQDSLVSLWMEVVGIPFAFQLYVDPMIREATADYHVLTPPPFIAPWVGATVNGVDHPDWNRCRFWVEQYTLPQATTKSFRSLVCRSPAPAQ